MSLYLKKLLPQPYKHLIFNKFSVIGILFIIYSLIVYFSIDSETEFNLKIFIIYSLISYFFWTQIGFILHILPTKIANIIIAILSFIFSFLLVSGIYIFIQFKSFLSSDLVIFLKNEKIYLYTYIKQIATDFEKIFILLILSIIFYSFLRYKKRFINKQIYFLLIPSIIIISFNNYKLNTTRDIYENYFLPIDIHTFFAFKLGLKNEKTTKKLKHNIDHNALKNIDKNTGYNVVLIVFESFSKEPLSIFGYDNNFTPFIQSWYNQEKNQFVLMQNSISICGATDVSMPTLYTGVGPEEPYLKFTNAPFMWDYAKKSGLETFIATSQSQEWKNFRDFVKDKYLDHYYYPDKLGLELINDVGADDLTVLNYVEKDFINSKKPFFFYYNTNATHGPYQDYSPQIKKMPDYLKTRYQKALYITDKIVEKIYDFVKQKDALDNTIFIFTADHGDYAVKRRQRLGSFFLETLKIPVFIRFPKKWIDEHKNEYNQIQNNAQSVRVSNLDLAPTIYEIITNRKAQENKYFHGKSLLGKIPFNRNIICLATNDYRQYKTEGFGIYNGYDSFLFHDNTGFHFYDLKTDPNQFNDLIDSISTEKKQFYDSIWTSNRYLKAVFERTKQKTSGN